jgi:hypothetical protein
MNNIGLRRFGAATGAAYVLLALLHGGGGNPAFHASEQEILTWVRDASTITSATYAGGLLGLLTLLAFLLFVVYLSSVLRRAEGDLGFLATAALSAGVVSVAIKLASFPPIVVARVWAQDGLDPRIIGMLFDLNAVSFGLTLAVNGLLLAMTAAVAIPTRVLPRWLGWGAALTALALFANLVIPPTGFAPSMLLFLLWTLVASVVLFRRAGTVPSTVATPGAGEPALGRSSPASVPTPQAEGSLPVSGGGQSNRGPADIAQQPARAAR